MVRVRMMVGLRNGKADCKSKTDRNHHQKSRGIGNARSIDSARSF
jgi:hypothetical protein